MVVPLMTSSPVVQRQSEGDFILPTNSGSILRNISPIKNNCAQENSTSGPASVREDSCKVAVQIQWPSKVRQKLLSKDLSSLGKMLCRGTFKQIARAAWRCKQLQQHFLGEIARQIHDECSAMCKRETKKKVKVQEASCLRKTDKESITNFSFEQLEKELKEKAPLFQLILKTASLRLEDKAVKSIQCVGVAAAVCVQNRSRNMTALQLILTIITQISGFAVSGNC